MPLFLIRRDTPGLTQEDLDAAAFRAITCAFYFSDMRWLQSFWDKGSEALYCIYEARDAHDIYAHAARARIPCDDVREVSHVGPELYVGEGQREPAEAG
jgi:hypothetical protein